MYLKGSVSGHSRRTCSRECIFLDGPGCTLASLPMCWVLADHIFAWTLLTGGGVSGRRNSSIRRLKPGEGSAYRSAPPEVGIILLRIEQGTVPLSSLGESSLGPKSGEGFSSSMLDAKSAITTLGVSEQGHMIVSPAVGRKRREKEPLKQCLKNTWRQVQKTRCCFSFRAPRTRSAGVGDVGTSSCLCVHLQMGRGVKSCLHAAKAACLGVEGGGLMWCASEASERSSARFQFFWGGPGQVWEKMRGSALDFLPGRQTEKG